MVDDRELMFSTQGDDVLDQEKGLHDGEYSQAASVHSRYSTHNSTLSRGMDRYHAILLAYIESMQARPR